MQQLHSNIKYKAFLPKPFNKNQLKQYLYTINYNIHEESLCKMEMKRLFNIVPKRKYFFSCHYVDPSRSPFIKHCICIMYKAYNLEGLIKQIVDTNLSCEKFKVSCINIESKSIDFHERRSIESLIGFNINGRAEMHNPNINFAVTNIAGTWILGKYEKNKCIWKIHNKKPYNYSNALDVRVSRTLVNIALGNDLGLKIIDPCCGIGTIVMDGLSLGADISGYEINSSIAENAKKNLKYFGYKDVITNADMQSINQVYDVAIVDLPYGLFSPITLKQQIDIIKCARRIANKMVIITFENMDEHLIASGFKIIDRCYASKNRFKRYITLCI